MKKVKIKLNELKVKSFLTNSRAQLIDKSKGTDGGFTWVG
jgi:hypothetical protein